MDKLSDQLTHALSQIQGPGMDAARRAVQIDAMTSVIWGFAGIALLIASIGAITYIVKKKPFGDEECEFVIPTGLCCLIMVFGIALSCNLINPWTWAAFYEPDAVIASKILRL